MTIVIMCCLMHGELRRGSLHEDNWVFGTRMGMVWVGATSGSQSGRKGEQRGDDGNVQTDLLEERREEWKWT